MAVPNLIGYAWNQTRHACLATELKHANTHWSRLCGLMLTGRSDFGAGRGLWIAPCHGIHTFAMRFPIDVVYLDRERRVVYLRTGLQPWRVAPVQLRATSVLELPENTLSATGTCVGDQIEIVMGKKLESVPA
jgi:uncharacterized membrane protein (UPF0127 family)